MNIVNKLTLRHLKENKRRTVVTVLGIAVSVAMITAVFVSFASFMNFFGGAEIYSTGNWHAVVYNTDEEQQKKLNSTDELVRVGYSRSDTPGENSFKIKNANGNYSTGDIYYGDYNNLNQKVLKGFDGELPKNSNEIAVDEAYIKKNNLDWKIGDTVVFEAGTRYITEDGEKFDISGSAQPNEKFEFNKNLKCKITAVTHSNNPTKNYGIIRVLEPKETAGCDAYIELAKVTPNALNDLKDILINIGISEKDLDNGDVVSYNSEYLASKLAISKDSDTAKTMIPMVCVILFIIMIASIMLIYNAFGMSLSEKTRYLGMLASVGATKIQKKRSVYFEGLAMGAVGIPVGMAAGIIGISITLKVLGDRIVDTGMIADSASLSMKVVVSPFVVIGVVIFSLLTIFISSFIPAKKASAITPIEAIRQSKDIKIKSKKVKSSPIIRKIFGYEGELANKNLKRNGRKARVIIVSISVSVILFLSVNYFCDLFVRANISQQQVPYNVSVGIASDKYSKMCAELSENKYVEDYFCSTTDEFTFYGENAKSTKNKGITNQDFAKKDILTPTYKNLFDKTMRVFVIVIDDEDFNQICKENNIDNTQYYTQNSDSVKCLLMNDIDRKNNSTAVFNNNVIGERLYYLSDGENKNETLSDYTVCGLVDYNKDNIICNYISPGYICAFAPLSMSRYVKDSSQYLDISVVTDNHTELCQDLFKLSENDKAFQSLSVMDVDDAKQMMDTIILVLQVFVYGFIALITLVTIANIINTISTGIDLRRKEFAMLKSVGTTPKGFNKMICLESLFYGLRALIFSIPISILISYLLNIILGDASLPFQLNIPVYIGTIAVVFLLIGISMIVSFSRLKDDSVVETLKEELN